MAIKHLKCKFGNSTSADKVVGCINDEEIVQDVEETGETGSKSDDKSNDDADEARGRAPQSFTSIVQQMERMIQMVRTTNWEAQQLNEPLHWCLIDKYASLICLDSLLHINNL